MMLIALAGLPGTGKTTIAKALALELRAMHVRIDTIEQAIRRSESLSALPMDDAGYLVAYALTEDNLRLGHIVISDCVNPWPETRDAWVDVARRAAARVVEVEVVCSNIDEHRRRVESRRTDIAGLKLPTWQDIVTRDYRPWQRDRIIVDTATVSVAQAVRQIVSAIATR